MSTPPNYIALEVTEQGSATVAGNLGISLNRGSYSLSSWVQYDAFSSNAAIVERQGEVLLRAMDNGFLFQISGRPPLVWQSPEPLTEGWYNLCVTFDNGTARLYVDGEFKQLALTGTSSTTSDKALVMGGGLQGLLWSVIVYNVTLSAQQVMDAQYGDLDASLVAAHFDFSQNPPIDTGPKALPVTLTPGAASVLVTPGLHTESTGYAYPMHDGAVNPGGQHLDPYTVQAWAYVDRQTPVQTIFVNSDLNADTGMGLRLVYDEAAAGFRLESQRGSGEDGEVVASAATIPTETWTNVATTFDGTTLTVYVDGVASGSKTCGPIPLSRPFGSIVIGAAFSETDAGGLDGLQGFLSRVEVWNRALSAAEIEQYQDQFPGPDAEDLVASYPLITAPARNTVNGHPVALADGAHLFHQIGAAPPGSAGTAAVARFEAASVSASRLAEWRDTVDHSSFLERHGHLLDAACEADMAAQGDPADAERIRAAYEDVKRRLASGAGPDMPLTFTEHLEDGRYYLVGHSRQGSYVAYEADAETIDDCTMWKVKLVFIVVAGALDAIFGVSARLSDKAVTFIQRVLANPRILATLSRGATITAIGIFGLLQALYAAGALRTLISIIVDLGFWSLIRVLAKAVLTFAGVGAADVLASLVATVALFIKTYLEKPTSCDPLPSVTLAAIKFNHDPTQAAVDALSIRVDRTTPVDVPEWRTGYATASQSPAAYAIDKVRGKTVTIQAKFTINTADAMSLQIQATGGGILGAIDPVTVNFAKGVSTPEYVTLSLPHHRLASGGVQAVDAAWTWQYKSASGAWTRSATSNHRIYAILSTPTMPWVQSPNPLESQLPWTRALEYACTWASGSTDANGALTAITGRVNSGYGLEYDTSSGASFYTKQMRASGRWTFLLSPFLERLGGGTGTGNKVNCTDCATIVSTFANLVGANVQASRMGVPGTGFDCNKIIAIGFSAWAYPFESGGKGHFSYHEVVWTAGAGVRDPIYDACLQLDSSDDPWNWAGGGSHTPKLPTNMVFTTQSLPTSLPIATPFSDQTYRERLAMNTSLGIGACSPEGQWADTQSGRRYVE